MSELIDRIPGQESMLGKLRGVVDTTAQIKAAQRFTGRSGQLGYAVENPVDWDYTTTVSSTPPAYLSAEFSIRFTGDGTQEYPIVVPSTDVRINGVEEANRLTIVPSTGLYTYTDGACDINVQTFELIDPDYLGDPVETRWGLSILYQGTATIRIKVRGQATSGGAFTVVRTA